MCFWVRPRAFSTALAPFDGAGAELLGLVLDLLVQALEGGEDAFLEVVFALQVHVHHALGVVAKVLEQTSHTAGAGAEVVAFLEGFVHGLLSLSVSHGPPGPLTKH